MYFSTKEASPENYLSPNQEGASPGSSTPDGHAKRTFRAVLIVVVAALVVGALLFAAFRKKTLANKEAQAANANFTAKRTLRLKGTTEAVRMRAVLAPVLAGQFVATLTVTRLTAAGTNVKQGALLAEFDRQAQTSSRRKAA
jgi:hypothetical protein